MSANTSASVSADSHNLRSRRHSPRLSDSTNAKSPLQAVFGVEPNSGTSTPISEHAPPSVFATKTARNLVRSQAKRRLFPTVDYESRVSHFDKDSEHHDFRGFFVLFWIALAIMVITTMLRNFSEFGYPLHFRQYETFTANIWELALADLLMVASTALTIPLHLLFKNSTGILRWEVGGVWIQSLFQLIWFAGWCSFPFYRHWTWTAQDFFTLHLIAILMKLHSYAFYNGHLARTLQRLNNLDKVRADVKLKSEATIKYAEDSDSDHSTTRVNDLLVSQLTQTKQSNTVMPVSELRDDLARELVSPFGNITYPQNITLANYLDFICCPTLCYELEYPRRAAISYMELFYKVLALFGCIFLLTVISEEYIMPVLDTAQTRLAYRQDWSDGCLIFAETASSLLFPFLGAFLLVFFSIFEYLCGAFAELTLFADRQFYTDWWNSSDWLEFNRTWNLPVHHWLHRHVYVASRKTMSKPLATLLVFFISSAAHELVMGCSTRKFRGYGFFAMLAQLPIVLMQRSPWMKHRRLLNNILFWSSMISGLAIICALYVLI